MGRVAVSSSNGKVCDGIINRMIDDIIEWDTEITQYDNSIY